MQDLEGFVAPAIQQIVETNTLPKPSGVETQKLLFFIALQTMRTPTHAGSMAEGFDKMLDLALADLSDLEKRRFKLTDAIRFSIETSALIAEYWSDLSIHLFVNMGQFAFVTSDNPAVLYNQYCEHLKGRGTTGAIKRGLMVFVPLSPRHLVLLYDSDVYKVENKRTSLSYVSNSSDLTTLNALQVINSENVLLFSDWTELNLIRQVVARTKKYRRRDSSEAVEFVRPEGSDSDFLFQIYPVPHNIHLNLSFVRLTRDAKRVPPKLRGLQSRPAHKQPRFPTTGITNPERERFVRKDLFEK